VFVPTYERYRSFEPTPVYMRDGLVMWRKDIGRAIDYLHARADIDPDRLGFMGASWGAQAAPFMLALEPRLRVGVLLSGGLTPRFGALPEANAINFLPRVTVPVLMVNGQFDAIVPVSEMQEPMFRLLGTPAADKRHLAVETGHGVTAPEARTTVIKAVLDWLDTYLGAP
jgi:eukaryotic-like serine/threonine-protein kinase